MEGGRERVQRRYRQAETDPEGRRGRQEQPVRERMGAREELARDEQGHRHHVGDKPGQEHPFEADSAGQASSEQRGRDGGRNLGQEQGAILRIRQPVVGGAGEDGAGGGERDQGDALDESAA